ncbi:MAG: S8 family peptidase [Flavobacteriales bacterium]|nr:S8 family peptidase [Flavobacteriales bacterium]
MTGLRRRWTIVFLFFSVIVKAPEIQGQKYAPSDYLFVKIVPGGNPNDFLEWVHRSVGQLGFEMSAAFPFSRTRFPHAVNRLAVVKVPKGAAGVAMEWILKSPLAERAEQVPPRRFFYEPNDLGPPSGTPNQYALHLCRLPEAWHITRGDSSISILISDNGFHLQHPDLIQQWVTYPSDLPNDGIDNDGNGYVDDYLGWNAVDNNGSVSADVPALTHATAVSGIASARTDNGLGIAGAGFSCRLLPVKISDSTNIPIAGYSAFFFAVDRGAHVINCSWGGQIPSFGEQSLVDYALSAGCVVVAAAGNDNDTIPVYPAAYPGVISVAATTAQDIRFSLSNFGSWISLCAPGHAIFTTDFNASSQQYTYAPRSGTSMATPLVAGVAGLMKSLYPLASPALVKQCLTGSADPIDQIPANAPYTGLLGSGRLNASAALACFRQFIPPKAQVRFSDDSTMARFCADDTIPIKAISAAGPIQNVTWQALSPGLHIGMPTDSITPVWFDNPGFYQLRLIVNNTYGSDTTEVTLEAISRPALYPALQRQANTLQCTNPLPYTYWFKNDTLLPWFSDTLNVTQFGKGLYVCAGATAPGGCRNPSNPIPVQDIITSFVPNSTEPEIFQTPQGFGIHPVQGPVFWSLFSITGQKMAVSTTAFFSLPSLSKGLYILSLTYENKNYFRRFVVW